MTRMEDLMRLKQARIDALQNEIAKLKSELEKLEADAEINNQFLTELYYENR